MKYYKVNKEQNPVFYIIHEPEDIVLREMSYGMRNKIA